MKHSKGIKIAVKQVTRDGHKIEEIEQRENIYIYYI